MFKKTLGALVASLALASILTASASATSPPLFDETQHSLTAADSIWVIANKKNPLKPLKYVPANLVKISKNNPYRLQLAKPAGVALVHLMNAAKAAGVGNITMVSGYRSYTTQKAVHADAVRKWGLVDGEKLAARPGFSEHQTGLAVDIYEPKQGCRIRVCFGATKAGAWVKKNAWKYGFIIRYPDGATPTTGYQYEPWHLRFVGVELTTEMNNKGVTVLEKFWKYKAAPKY
jgi:D-alanyl-D-alanine carboxypeptidase